MHHPGAICEAVVAGCAFGSCTPGLYRPPAIRAVMLGVIGVLAPRAGTERRAWTERIITPGPAYQLSDGAKAPPGPRAASDSQSAESRVFCHV